MTAMKMRDLQQHLETSYEKSRYILETPKSPSTYQGTQPASFYKTIKTRGAQYNRKTQHCWQISWGAGMQDILWNQGIIKKKLYLFFNSALLYSFSARKNGTTVLKTPVHSKLKQRPVKTNPGQQKHIQINFSKYIGRWRSCKSWQMKECPDE